MSKIKVGLPKLTYSGQLGRTEEDGGPKTMEEGGLISLLEDLGCSI
jgi:hypothetical protein